MYSGMAGDFDSGSTQADRQEEVFAEAVRHPAGPARVSYLDAVCAGDAALRQRIEVLLAAHEAAVGNQFLDLPGLGATTDTPSPLSEAPGTKIGHYKLLQQIGEGGFGVVFMAEQEFPVRRKVALKIIKLGMDTRQVVARFEAERQALAMMDHPSVAKVFDGGATETGRPYFVMELVSGKPITQYCDEHKLTIRQRVELFAQVCQAVQHAHQKGLIHRDIKPSNVLVSTQDDRPTAKVIDFGIAKATEARLTEKTLFTDFRQMIGTPEYMSPEQADGDLDIDTRTDVYSLGVLLYELLAGSPPFDPKELRSKAFAEMQRIIREVEPARPSTRLSALKDILPTVAARRDVESRKLQTLIRGELDWIVMRCLEKDRTRRYETVNALCRDVERFLAEEPVQACPPSKTYRLRKFVRRNRAGVLMGLAALAVSAILTVSSVYTHQQRRAAALLRTEQHQTKQALEKAEGYRHQTERLAAMAALDNGFRACDQGDPARGLLWLGRSLKLLPALETDRERAIRASISGWADSLHFELSSIHSHEGWVHCVTFSPDGKTLASGGVDQTVRLWDVDAARSRAEPMQHQGLINAACFSPDGNTLATASEDGFVRLWNPHTGHLIRDSWKHADMAYAVAFSPDGTQLASGGRDRKLHLWDISSGNPVITPIEASSRISSLAYLPDGNAIVACSGNRICMWNAHTGEMLGKPQPAGGSYPELVLSGDGKTLAVSVTENVVYVIDVDSWSRRLQLPHRGSVNSMTFTRNDRALLTGCADGNVRMWDLANGELLGPPIPHVSSVHSVAASPNGDLIASGTSNGQARIWRRSARRKETAFTLGQGEHVIRVSVSHDGTKLLVSNLFGDVTVRDIADGSLLRSLKLERDLHVGEFSPDGRTIVATWNNHIQLFDSMTLAPVTPRFDGEAKFLAARFSPDGRYLLTGSMGRVAQLWHADTCLPHGEPIVHPHWVHSVAFSPDGESFVTGCEDCFARHWTTGTHRQIGSALPHQGPVWGVAISPDGATALTGSWGDGVARLWDLRTGREKLAMFNDRGSVNDVAFSPDGRIVATAHWDKAAQMWDATTGIPLGPPIVFDGGVRALCFTPDARMLVSGDYVGNVKIVTIPLPASGEARMIADHISSITGLELSANAIVTPLAEPEFRQRKGLQPRSEPPGLSEVAE